MELFNKINNRYINFLKKIKINKFFPNNIILFAFMIYTIIFFSNSLIHNTTIIKSFDEKDFIAEAVTNNRNYLLNTDGVEKFDIISIKIGTYGKKVNNNYKFEFYKNNEIIYSKKVNTLKTKDNDTIKFKLDNSCHKKDNYHVKIIPLTKKRTNEVAVFVNKNNEIFSSYEIKSKNMLFSFIIFFLSLTIFFIINYFINTKRITIERVLLSFSLYFFILVFLIPPFHAPDEYYHFSQSYGLASHFYSSQEIEIPANYKCLFYGNESNNVKNLKDIARCMISKKSHKTVVFDSRLQSYNIAHILISIPIKIIKLFTSSPIIIFFIGRIMNLILNVIILYLSLKLLPFGKKNLLLIIAIPAFIQQFITYSYDGLANSISTLLISYIINWIYRKDKMNLKSYLFLVLFLLLILNLKMPYAAFGGLIFLISKSKFDNSNIKKYGIIILILILSFILYKLFNYLININDSALNTLATNSIINFIKNPIDVLKILKNTILINYKFYIISMIGGLDWLNIYINYFYINSIVFMFLLLLFSGENELDQKSRLWDLAINIIIFIGILLALYTSWTEVDARIISGVQGRYFLPLLLPLSLVFMTKKRYITISEEFVEIFSNIIIISYIFTLLVAYY